MADVRTYYVIVEEGKTMSDGRFTDNTDKWMIGHARRLINQANERMFWRSIDG